MKIRRIIVVSEGDNYITKIMSRLYFKDISSMKEEVFNEKIKDLTKENYEDSLIEQIYVLSGIATKKHQQFSESVGAFLLGTILLLVWILLII